MRSDMQYLANQIPDSATRRAVQQLIIETIQDARVPQWGDRDNYTRIEADGTIKFVGNATVWEDLRVPMTATKGGGVREPGFAKLKDNGDGSTGVYAYWFDKTNIEELFFACQLPHSWAGTLIYPHVHFVPKTDGGATHRVRWGLEYTWAGMGQVYGDTNILYASSAAALDAGRHYLTPFAAITPNVGQATLSSMLVCRVFRDATHTGDDYDDDAGLLEIDFHYEINTVGSREPLSK